MSHCLRILTLGLLATLAACKQASVTNDVPARIVEPTAASRAELHNVIAGALDNDKVTLAPDALTQSSILNLEHHVFRDPRGNRIQGRDLGRPVQFRLIRNGDKCVLTRPATDERWTLQDTDCVAD